MRWTSRAKSPGRKLSEGRGMRPAFPRPPADPASEAHGDQDRGQLSAAWTNWPVFTIGMVRRGYSDQDIQKILGGYVIRVAPAGRLRVRLALKRDLAQAFLSVSAKSNWARFVHGARLAQARDGPPQESLNRAADAA